MMLVNCSGCRTPLQLPPGARSIRCAVCHAVTRVVGSQMLHPCPPSQHQLCSVASYSPSPYAVPGGPPPSPHGRKRAVICGISYRYPRSRYKLKGSINDARCMKYLLVKRFGFPEASIVMLTGDPWDSFLVVAR